MRSGIGQRLPGCLRGFPGAVLHLSAAGTVLDSNGRLEGELGHDLVGRPFADALDADSCGTKWERMLASAPDSPGGVDGELILTGRDTLPEPRSFSVLWEPEAERVWLMEHPRDPRLDHLRAQVTEVNSELANAQRDLLRERGRLAQALAELQVQYREQERLAGMLREQNEEIEAQSEELLATTEELQARGEELERSNRALDEFAHVVSHDLKAPLRSVTNAARWLAEDLDAALSEETRAHMDLLHGQVRRMRAIIDGILDYARAGRERSAPEPVDVSRLVHEIVELLDPPASVVITVDDELPTLRAERTPLQQVLQNLIDNAIKHAGRHAGTGAPRVDVRSGGPRGGAGEWWEFAVQDNGPGIAAALQDRIWTPFFTAPSQGQTDGTGIGLAVVRRLVEAQGGRVWVESEEGAGATFRFLWPMDSAVRG